MKVAIKYLFTTVILAFLFLNTLAQNSDSKIEELIEQGLEVSYDNLDSSLIIFNQALEIAVKEKDKEYEARVLGEIGKVYYFMNDVENASSNFQKSLNIAVETENYLQAIKMCNNLGLINLYIQEYEVSYNYFNLQLGYSIKSNDSIGISESYNNFGTYFLNIDQIDSSILYYEKSLDIAEKINYLEYIATVNTNIAIDYHTLGNLTIALKYNMEAARLFDEIGDLHNYALTIGNIGALYLDNKEYEKAKKYLLDAYNLKDSIFIEDYYLQTNMINLGIVYIYFKDLELSEKYFSEALEITTKNEDVKAQVTVYLNLITVYLNKNDNLKALEYAELALKLSLEIESEQYTASSYKKLGQVYNALGKYNLAIENLKTAYEMSIEMDYLTYILDILEELKIAYKSIGDYKNAFETDELYIMFQDSLTGIETQKQLAELTTVYETEKKEQEIEKQKLEIKAKNLKIKQGNTIIFSVSAVLLLLILLSVVLITSIRAKKRANRLLTIQKKMIEQKNEELKQLIEEVSTQKEEIEHQRDIANQQKEEILSSISYAQRIQRAVLPSKEFVDEILPENFVLFRPRDIVSGDFYWLKKIRNLTIVAVADCTGHGVPGAFMSMLGSAFLNDLVTVKSLDTTGKILNSLRDRIKKSLKQTGEEEEQKDGMDIAFYVVNSETLELQFSGAYNSMYIIRPNLESSEESLNVVNQLDNSITLKPDNSITRQLIELKADRQPIAVHVVEKDFTTQKFQLHKGDCLYSFSDGYTDQFGGESNSKYMTKNFKKLLLSIFQKSMQEQKHILDEELLKWRGEKEQTDDVLVIGVRI